MKERPILFSGAMVRAILSGRKTQTRRVVKPQIDVPRASYGCIGGQGFGFIFGGQVVKCPYGELGDRLWVREAFYQRGHWEPVPGVRTAKGRQKWRFVAHGEIVFEEPDGASVRKGRHHKDPETVAWHKRLARFMPRKASRITLEIVSVRVERLQDISEGDAMAEGIEPVQMPTGEVMYEDYLEGGALVARAVSSYATLWDRINGAGAFSTNPWVWVVEFKKL